MKKENIVAKLDVSENNIEGSLIDGLKRVKVLGYKVTIYNQGNSLYANKEDNNRDFLLVNSEEGIGNTIYLIQNINGKYTGSKFRVNEKFPIDTFYEFLNKKGLETKNNVLPIEYKNVKYKTESIDMILR